ncbi:cold shock domain-containing protein [Solimonas sp. SE-A11]|uniref:excalibur calcium-binding domain-containing protein n=1 Tax=Solimonas sp. SE-A11 TaxID=3054954 RepID=UPI00259CE2E6|nr:cold shock domain-containing protein [Solimonas sp. SE-A11]MDM4769193.1 excalibur calcium-binding domain-containing protein [Solimonas sp. SE-A11]
MRYQGRIIEWNDAKGFGYIEWHGASDKLFLHISAFADRSRRPRLGDIVTYEAERDPQGRHRAVKVAFPASASRPRDDPARHVRQERRRSGGGWLGGVIIASIFAGGLHLYSGYQQARQPELGPEVTEPVQSFVKPVPVRAPGFSCDGKVYCSEMSSCDEARYYLAHCPGVKMDGDGDGKPCEKWCGY